MMIVILIFLLGSSVSFGQQQCATSLKPEKLVVVGVWKRSFDNSTAQYRISDEDLSVRGYERAERDKASSTVMLARHPEGCVLNDCGVRLTAMMQINGAILHTDHRNVKLNDSTMNNIEDEFYCAERNNSCGADVPIYRLVKHSLTGPHYAYSFDNTGQSLPGYEKEFFPLCFAWRQSASVVLFNSSDDAVCLTLPEIDHGRIVYSTKQLNIYSIGVTATLQCDHGFSGGGTSSLLCTKEGWYPKRGLGKCEEGLKRREPQLIVSSGLVQQVTESGCPIPSSTPHGNVVYSANVASSTSKTTVPSATRATVLCNLGTIPTTQTTSSKCVNGEWVPSLPSCISLLELKCPILSVPSNAELVFTDSSVSPYNLNSVVSLKCDRNFYGVGNLSATCTSSGWNQKIGRCEANYQKREKRQISTGVACSALTTPSNGNLLYMQANPTTDFSSGTSGYLMCNLGYSLTGSVSSICTNGVWSPTIGQCTNALQLGQATENCQSIGDRTNGTVTYTSIGTYPSGTIATLTCNLMNTVSGSSTSTCLSGVWNPTLGNCLYSMTGSTGVGGVCTNPTVVNGQITYSQGNTFDLTRPASTVATLTCNSGYSLSGTASSTCTNGVFTPTLGTCNLGGTSGTGGTTCANPTVVNGQISYSQGNTYDLTRPLLTVATLTCNSGYTRNGNPTATCIGGTFTPSLGTCTLGSSVTYCTSLTVLNGQITYNQGNTFDLTRPSSTIATLTCNSGYTLSGTSSSTCSNGVFTPTIGTCSVGGTGGTGTTCTSLTVVNGQVTYSQGNTFDLTRPPLTVATLTCNSGYSISGTSTSTCSNGVFTPSLGTCNFGSSGTGTTCTNPTVVNGQITYSQGNTYDLTRPLLTVATLTCNSGYTRNGNPTATCIGGTFTPSLGTCTFGNTGTSTVCTSLTVLNGQITYNQGNTYDLTRPSSTVATLTCNSGYTLSGTSSSTCTNGVFTPTLGTCNLGGTGGISGMSCLNPIIMNGQLSYSQGNTYDITRPSSTTATLTCNSGYTLSGSASATCSNGVYTPTLGTCNLGSNGGSTGTLQCTAMIAPLGGNVTYSIGGSSMGQYQSGTIATGSCTNGGAITGASTATCSNGMWTPTFLGTCSLIGGSTTGQCSALTVPTGAQATYSPFSLSTTSFTSGTVATVTCTSGGTMLGTSTCTNGIWSPSITQTCSNSGTGQCSSLTRPVGESVTYDGQTSFSTSFATGTIARVTCSNGTQIGQSTCYSGTWTPAITTTCSGSSTAVGTQCIGVIVPTNSQVTYSDGSMVLHSAGTTATLTCLNSASLTGNSFATCSNGVWTPTLGSCTSSQGSTGPCYTPPLTPTGATITYSSGYFAPWTSGSSATMSCPAGQTAVGTTVAYCTNAAWSPSLGTCSGSTGTIGQGCTPLSAFQGTLTNGRMEYTPTITTRVPIGTVVNVMCYSGYSLSGNSLASCTASGWSPSTIGSCVQQVLSRPSSSCPEMSTVSFGSLSYSVSGNDQFPSGTTVTLRCDTNYTMSNGSSIATCHNGLWSPTSLATCQKVQKAVISLTCPLGIAPVLSANMVYSNGSPLGPYPTATAVTATCTSGFVPNGIMTATCTNGVWSPPTLGTCDLLGNELGGTSCGRLGDILSGTLVYSALGLGPYPSGTSVTVLCNIGSTLSGSASAICTNGVWNPLPGTCIATILRKQPVKNNNITQLIVGGNETQVTGPSDDAPRVALSGMTCPPPVAPAFGEITFSELSTKGSFEDGTTAALKCNYGYKPTGPSFSTCRKGLFRPIIGKCSNGSEFPEMGICVPLSPPKNARVVYIQSGSSLDFQEGTTALLYCEEGFAVTGVATLQCQSGQWEPSTGFGMCDSI